MAIQNPFSGDAFLGDVWEQGYLAGYAEPETDHFRPFESDALDVYKAGELEGRNARRMLPPDEGGEASTEHSQLKEIAGEVGLHALGHGFFEMIFGKVGGLISLVTTVLQIPGDVQLRPLEEDWTGPGEETNQVGGEAFVAVCPRVDHAAVMTGVTPEGYWAGPSHDFFSDALADKQNHDHPEAGVARCSTPDGTCGLVWPGAGQ